MRRTNVDADYVEDNVRKALKESDVVLLPSSAMSPAPNARNGGKRNTSHQAPGLQKEPEPKPVRGRYYSVCVCRQSDLPPATACAGARDWSFVNYLVVDAASWSFEHVAEKVFPLQAQH